MADQKEITVRLKSVQLLSFGITEAGRNLTEPLIPDDCQFNWDLNFKTDVNTKTIRVILKTALGSKKDVPMVELVGMETQMIFEVLNLDEFVDPKTKKAKLPVFIMPKLGEISISTARGIFLVSVAGTIFSNALVPLVNLASLQPPKKAIEQLVT